MLRIIGMNNLKNEIEKLLENVNAYRKGCARVPNFIINLDSGNGQTYVTEAITDVLVNNKLREFHGLDEFLEYKPDGTLQNIKWMFENIRDNAVYDNVYKGVVSIDITKIANNQNGYEVKYFEEHLKEVAETATIIIYCSTSFTNKENKFKERFSKIVGNVKEVEVCEYTSIELAEMVVKSLMERGIDIKDEKNVIKVISIIITNMKIEDAKSAMALAEKLLFHVDYSKTIPVLNFSKANDFNTNYCKEV